MNSKISVSVPTEFSSNLLHCKVEPNTMVDVRYNPAQLVALQEEMKRQQYELMKSQKIQQNFQKYKMNVKNYKEYENENKIREDSNKAIKINNQKKAKEYNENLRRKMLENEANKQKKKLNENKENNGNLIADELNQKKGGINRIKSFSFKEIQNIQNVQQIDQKELVYPKEDNNKFDSNQINSNENNCKDLSTLILSQINNDNSNEMPLTDNILDNLSFQISQNNKEISKVNSIENKGKKKEKEKKGEFNKYDFTPSISYEKEINENLQRLQNFRNLFSNKIINIKNN